MGTEWEISLSELEEGPGLLRVYPIFLGSTRTLRGPCLQNL